VFLIGQGIYQTGQGIYQLYVNSHFFKDITWSGVAGLIGLIVVAIVLLKMFYRKRRKIKTQNARTQRPKYSEARPDIPGLEGIDPERIDRAIANLRLIEEIAKKNR
jgi:hypothetical protein